MELFTIECRGTYKTSIRAFTWLLKMVQDSNLGCTGNDIRRDCVQRGVRDGAFTLGRLWDHTQLCDTEEEKYRGHGTRDSG